MKEQQPALFRKGRQEFDDYGPLKLLAEERSPEMRSRRVTFSGTGNRHFDRFRNPAKGSQVNLQRLHASEIDAIQQRGETPGSVVEAQQLQQLARAARRGQHEILSPACAL